MASDVAVLEATTQIIIALIQASKLTTLDLVETAIPKIHHALEEAGQENKKE